MGTTKGCKSSLIGEYPCRKNCGWISTMPGGRARHETKCVQSLEDLIVRLNRRATETGCWVPESGSFREQRGKIAWIRPFDGVRSMTYVYRIAYYYSTESWPENEVCHSCDNGACFNPDHLWDGTRKENARDMADKGRSNLQRRTPEERRAAAAIAGTASMTKRTAEQRTELAQKGANTRWAKARENVQNEKEVV